MKKLSILLMAFVAFVGLNSCSSDDDVVFIAQPDTEGINFTNSFNESYILSPATSGNIAERFVWNTVDFDVPTNITYQLQASISEDFSNLDLFINTGENNIGVKVSQLKTLATDAGMDDDAETEAPNSGLIYFRVKAFAGTDGGNGFSETSETKSLNIILAEKSLNGVPVCEFDQLWAVGSAMPDAGWGWSTPAKFACSGNGVYSGNVYLVPDDLLSEGVEAFRFFSEESNWDSGQNYPSFVDNDYTIDELFRDAEDGDNNFEFLGDAGNYSLTIDTNNKTITVGEQQVAGVCEFDQLWIVGSGTPDAGWGWATPVQVICNGEGVYSTHVNLIPDDLSNGDVEAFRFFTEESNWDSGKNYPGFIAEDYTIDALFRDAGDGDNNFEFLGDAGNYLLTVDTVAKTITLK